MSTARASSSARSLAVAVLFVPCVAFAQQDAGETGACTEHVPEGAARPEISETCPSRAYRGYAPRLEVTVVTGKGETVLPEGLKLETGSDAARALEGAGFVLPEPDGGAGPTLATDS